MNSSQHTHHAAAREAKLAARLSHKPVCSYPSELPVSQRADEIAALIREHQVVIVCGETGSGKTTQLPKICMAAGRGERGLIGHTQPRRMAARAVATRIAHELNSPLGEAVGFKVRFTDKTSPNAWVKLMTDGILLAEAQRDPLLSAYDAIIVDEAHERSLNIDFLLGFLKQLCGKRPDLKVVITSATIDAERFARHFGSADKPAPVIEVSGRTYPVTIRYRPLSPDNNSQSDDDEIDNEEDIEDAIADVVEEVWRGGAGDILVFLPGEREIRETAEVLQHALRARPYAALIEILPLYARLSVTDQQKIFAKSNGRRIVLATNVAETSLTVPGIRYVIDAGLARVKRYSLRNKTTLLHIEKISQAAARQRAGRCGRVEAGVCVRLYSEEDFLRRPQYTDPELLRSSLADVILRMAALKLGRAETFPFIEAPSARAIGDGYQLLFELGAMDEAGELTQIGRELSRLPLDPRIGRIVLASRQHKCLPEALVIASALAVADPRERPFDKQQAADQAHLRFRDERSDFLSLVWLWQWFAALLDEKLSHRKNIERCRAQFVNYLRLREWRDVHQQLVSELTKAEWKWDAKLTDNINPVFYRALHESLLSGLLSNIGYKGETDTEYQGARGIRFALHPGSGLKKGGRWLLAAELTETTRLYARCAAKIEPEWIEAVAKDRVTREYYDPHWDNKRGEVVGFERVRLYGLTLIARRPIAFTRVDPQVARQVFIREALVTGDLPPRLSGKGSFIKHNQQLIDNIAELENKARRQDVLVDDEAIAYFYEQRVPQSVLSLTTFEQWYKGAVKNEPELLFLTRDELMRHAACWVTGDLFPDHLDVEQVSLPLLYRFEPGHPLDGMTLTVPLQALNKLDAARLSWLVPGMVRDKLTWYIKALPKAQRNRLVPVPDAVTAFLTDMPFGEGSLAEALRSWFRKKYQSDIETGAWNERDLPPYLTLHYKVIDDDGQVLREGDDLPALRAELAELVQLSFVGEEAPKLEKHGLKCWDFGDLPETLTIEQRGEKWIAYPALFDEGDSAALLLCDTLEAAQAATRGGVLRLIRIALKDILSRWEKQPPGFNQAALQFKTLIPSEQLLADVLSAACDRAFIGDDPLPRNEKAFAEQVKRARTRWTAVAESAFRLLNEIASEHQQLVSRLHNAPATMNRLKAEIKAQRDALIYPGFFSQTPWQHLTQLPRYIKAMDRRIAKYPERVARDQKHGEQMAQLWQRYQERRHHNQKLGIVESGLEDYRWMLEEMRVSLFAQELKTAYPVSFQRLEKVWSANASGAASEL